MFVSFSRGKDSTVTSDVVMRALGRENIIHIYGDTTLEYPTTGEYLKRFREKHKHTPMLIAKNKEQNFNELCKIIGPPSRMMRWCCTIFKTGAITRKIDTTFRDKKNILTFQGIRRNESTARSKYERESNDSKIAKQIAVSPIIDWLEFDIWLYILSNKIDSNDAYRQGFVLNRKTNEPILKLTGRKGQRILKVSVLKFIGTFKDMKTSDICNYR